MGLKETVHEYLEKPPAAPGPRMVQFGIMLIIIVNVAAVVVETMSTEVIVGGVAQAKKLEDQYPRAFAALEWISVAIFTAEYLLRIFCITADERFAHPVRGRIRFALTPMALVDLLSILPTYFQASGFIAARSLRLIRIFRVFKLGHYSMAVRSLNRALVAKRAELLVTIFVVGILLVLVSTLMYHVEHDETSLENKFTSIPATMWWGIVTLTTVGYGDISPTTSLGKLLGGVVSIFGIGLVALPAGILGSAFVEELSRSKRSARCPHCGKDL